MVSYTHNAQTIYENLATAVLVFDEGLVLRSVNPAAEMLLAVSARKITDLPLEQLPIADEAVGSILQWALEQQRPFSEREVSLARFDQSTVEVDMNVSPLLEPDVGRAILVELIPVDGRIQRTQDNQILNQHATVQAMVRGLAHEIRNPLGGLRGAAQLLAGELQDKSLREYTNVIIGEADRLQKLLDRMLGPRSLPQIRNLNIHEVTARVCKLIVAESAEGLNLKCEYDPSIPDLKGDPDLLIQAVLNVARNAVQAIAGKPDGQIILRTRVKRQFTIGNVRYRLVIKLDIIDNGEGISEEMQAKLFFPMASGRAGGTGLGLSIAQSLIQQHRGLIHCESRPGETTMSIIIPIEEDASE